MSSMFKKRGGLAFKPKSVRRPPAAGIATPQASSAADSPEETAAPLSGAPPKAPSIRQTETDTHESTPIEPSPPASSSEQDTRDGPFPAKEASDSRSRPEVAEQSASASAPALDESTLESAAQQPNPPSEPVVPIQTEAVPQPTIERESAPPVAEIEKETPDQPSAQSTGALETSAEPPPSESTPSTSEHSTQKKAARPAAAKGRDVKESSAESLQPKKRQRKAQSTPDNEQEQDGEDQDGDSQTAPKKRRRKSKDADGKPKTRRTRELTPEDAEDQVVDHQKLTMADLTRDLHIGKKFSRHDELRERERQARLKAKLGKDDPEAAETPSSATNTPNPSASKTQTAPPTPAEQQQQQGSGVQFRMVDGQIVLDQSSLVMDRHARAAATQQDMETIEENDFTRLITSSSYMSSSKLKGPNIWTAEETVLFYRGLEMFGTDFEIIAQMFPGKQRRSVKLKFNREERHNPKLVDAALTGVKKTPMDMDEYKALTGGVFESVESIEAQHREHEEHFEARQKQLADEQAEIMRKRKEELFADDNGNDGEAGAADSSGKKKKKGKGKKRQYDPASLGDPEVIMDL
jgi:transcription factor TFIIIB component B''